MMAKNKWSLKLQCCSDPMWRSYSCVPFKLLLWRFLYKFEEKVDMWQLNKWVMNKELFLTFWKYYIDYSTFFNEAFRACPPTFGTLIFFWLKIFNVNIWFGNIKFWIWRPKFNARTWYLKCLVVIKNVFIILMF